MNNKNQEINGNIKDLWKLILDEPTKEHKSIWGDASKIRVSLWDPNDDYGVTLPDYKFVCLHNMQKFIKTVIEEYPHLNIEVKFDATIKFCKD